ncbi:MAG: rhodanese-like domain-containing protein [Anaerovoracaceae bacterium]
MKGFFGRASHLAKYIRTALILCLVLAVCGGVFSACGQGGNAAGSSSAVGSENAAGSSSAVGSQSGDAAGSDPAKEDGYMKITMEQAQNLMKTEENYIILDVRREDEYAAGHIPGAALLPNETITAETASEVLPDQDQMILVYCRSGNRSKQAAAKLADLGYSDIREFGGILDWPGEIEK